MADRGSFLRAILADPDDDRPRLLFADWLDEIGEPERAKFIRVQLAEAAGVTAAPPGESLCAAKAPGSLRSVQLLEKFERDWLSDWSAGLSEVRWRRGLIETATTSAGLFVVNIAHWLVHEPIQRWSLHSLGMMSQGLAHCPGLQYVRSLEINADAADLAPVIRGLADSRYTVRLRELYLPGPAVPENAIHALLSSHGLPALRHVAPFSSRPELLRRFGWWTRRAFRARFVRPEPDPAGARP